MVKSWIEVSQERLAANFRVAHAVLRREAGDGASLLAVVKANAYGHSAELCAPVLARAGAAWLGVTDAAEGAAVREALRAGAIETQPSILVMCGHLPPQASLLVRHGLTPVVWTVSQMQALAAAAGAEALPVHLEIDTGMSRQGVALGELREVLAWIANERRLRLDGVMTHFAAAEVAGSAQTESQREQFAAAIERVAAAGLRPRWVHAGNTSALDNGADDHGTGDHGMGGGTLRWLRRLADGLEARTMARAGLALYGYALPLAGLVASDGEEASRLARTLLPVMTWKTRIVGLSRVEAGTRIGYNGAFVARRSMSLALLPVGYADGLRRELSSTSDCGGGWVMLGGRRAPVVGRISMNLTTVDVTEMEQAAVGDEVILLGEGITAEDHAALAGTIPYEILCGVRAEPCASG